MWARALPSNHMVLNSQRASHSQSWQDKLMMVCFSFSFTKFFRNLIDILREVRGSLRSQERKTGIAFHSLRGKFSWMLRLLRSCHGRQNSLYKKGVFLEVTLFCLTSFFSYFRCYQLNFGKMLLERQHVMGYRAKRVASTRSSYWKLYEEGNFFSC